MRLSDPRTHKYRTTTSRLPGPRFHNKNASEQWCSIQLWTSKRRVRNCLGRICFTLQGAACDVDTQTSHDPLKMGDSTDDNIPISGTWSSCTLILAQLCDVVLRRNVMSRSAQLDSEIPRCLAAHKQANAIPACAGKASWLSLGFLAVAYPLQLESPQST